MKWNIFLHILLIFAALLRGASGRVTSTSTALSNYDKNNIIWDDNYSPNYYPIQNSHLRYPHQLSRKECDGEENFKSDIGIVSFMLSLISSTAGLFSLVVLSIPSNNITIVNTILGLILWVPSAILTFFAWSDPLSWATGNFVNLVSFFNTIYGGFGIITGTADIVVSTVDEVLGITALALGALTTFPETYDDIKEKVEGWLGRDLVEDFLSAYGCGYPQVEFGF